MGIAGPGGRRRPRDVDGGTSWVLGFGSLVDPDDPLVRRLAIEGRAVPGEVTGMRRTWAAGLENRAPENDGKHHLDEHGARPDVCVAALSADEHPGSAINVLALPVDADALARTDARERGYERLEVSDRFSVRLDGPVWIYRATASARRSLARADEHGRAVVSRAYVDRVQQAFAARGPDWLAAYRASTDAPAYPLMTLRLHRAGE